MYQPTRKLKILANVLSNIEGAVCTTGGESVISDHKYVLARFPNLPEVALNQFVIIDRKEVSERTSRYIETKTYPLLNTLPLIKLHDTTPKSKVLTEEELKRVYREYTSVVARNTLSQNPKNIHRTISKALEMVKPARLSRPKDHTTRNNKA